VDGEPVEVSSPVVGVEGLVGVAVVATAGDARTVVPADQHGRGLVGTSLRRELIATRGVGFSGREMRDWHRCPGRCGWGNRSHAGRDQVDVRRRIRASDVRDIAPHPKLSRLLHADPDPVVEDGEISSSGDGKGTRNRLGGPVVGYLATR
jgi:hypothetical protein